MSPVIEFTVYGQPAPQGSKRAFAVRGKGGIPTGKVAVIESSHDRVKSWRQAVIDAAHSAAAASGARSGLPLTGPVRVELCFALPRPKSHYRTGRNAGQLRVTAPVWPAGKPDLSKLLRSTEDALTDAGIWRDDSQVISYSRLNKIYAGDNGAFLSVPGAYIAISLLGAE